VQEVFVTFPELKDHGFPWSRVHVNHLMDLGIFAPAIRLSANRIAWRLSDLERFKASRPPAHEPPPRLWPPRERPAKPVATGKPVGRPRGSRVVTGTDGRRRLVLPEVADAG
jgi:hypothetical protein